MKNLQTIILQSTNFSFTNAIISCWEHTWWQKYNLQPLFKDENIESNQFFGLLSQTLLLLKVWL